MSTKSRPVRPDEITRHRRWLHRVAIRLVGSDADADDLVQETMAAALTRPPADDRPVGPWLGGVLRNIFRMRARGTARRGTREGDNRIEPGETFTPEALVERAEALQVLARAVAALDEPYRTTVTLRFRDGLSTGEIARRLNVPEGTIRWRLSYALDELRVTVDVPAEPKRRAGLAMILPPDLFRRLLRAPESTRGTRTARVSLAGLASWTAALTTAAALVAALSAGGPAAARTPVGERRDPQPSATKRSVPRFAPASIGADQLAPAAVRVATCAPLGPQLRAAGAHDTIRVPACIFREELVIDRPLTLEADDGAEIRGSDLWTEFDRIDAGWRSRRSVPAFPRDPGFCAPGAGEACRHPEQVFVDEKPWMQVDGDALPAPGQFLIDPSRRVILGGDPAGRTVEVTVRAHWIRGEADGVRIAGFRMRHAASSSLSGALVTGDHAGWTIERNHLLHTHGNALRLAGDDHRVMDNEIAHAGDLAVSSIATTMLLARNRLHHGNANRFDWRWQGGGAKLLFGAVVISDNRVHDNEGPGLWCSRCRAAEVHGNRVHDNVGPGILLDLSRAGAVATNTLWANGWSAVEGSAGIVVGCSPALGIARNLVAWSPDGITVSRARPTAASAGPWRAAAWDPLACEDATGVAVPNWSDPALVRLDNDVLLLPQIGQGDQAPSGHRPLPNAATPSSSSDATPAARSRGSAHSNRSETPPNRAGAGT